MKPPLSNGALAGPDVSGSNPSGLEISTRYPREVVEPKNEPHLDNRPSHLLDAEGRDEPTFETPQASATNPLLNNLIFLIAGALIASAGIFVTRQPTTVPIQLQPPPTVAPTATPLPTPTAEPITVFVSGAVQSPGMYELFNAARVGDALLSAGGLLPDAEAALINQAERLFDGAQVHVPSAIEVVEVEIAQQENSPPLLNNQPPAGLSGSTAPAASLGGTGGSNLININSATAAELETLPGVGTSRAGEIIAGRPYSTIDELQKVSGIGVKTVEKLRSLVTVD